MSANQIVLIGPASKDNSIFSDIDEFKSLKLVTCVKKWHESEGILITTSKSFKGLESDVVILYELDSFSNLFRLEDLYVACTRAKVLLIAFAQEGECLETLKQAVKN